MSSREPKTQSDQTSNDEDELASGPQLLDRTFAILALFTPDSLEWTTTEAARACGLPVPTVHRILTALLRHGYVARDELTKRFRLGPAALTLGRHARSSVDMRTVSVPVLRRLAEATGETVLLTAISHDRTRSVCLERVESQSALRLSVEPGLRGPLHAGASQKALLAFMPKHEVDAILSRELVPLCDSTITDPNKLREELATIRTRGWSTSYQETDFGLWGIAVTLLDSAGETVAAVGLAGPRVRLPKSRVKELLAWLGEGAAEIAATVALRTSIQASNETQRRRPKTGDREKTVND